MYIIKQLPEDFIVKELNSRLKPANQGEYSYFLLKKRNYTTERAVQQIADMFRIKRKFINYAGNKDKQAVTSQYISINKLNPILNKNHQLKDIELTFFGKGDERINLGFLDYNDFEIIVRNLDKDFKPNKIKQIPNYFDEQRFSKQNHLIGKEIVKGNFKRAVELIAETSEDYKEKTNSYLQHNKNNYVGALRLISRKIITLFVNSYQSLIFNKTITEFLKLNPKKNIKIPIVGFGTVLSNKPLDNIIIKIMAREKITQRDFIIKQIPELSSEGTERDLFLELKSLNIGRLEDDELNKGRKKVKIAFKLGKGSYATIVIKFLFEKEPCKLITCHE